MPCGRGPQGVVFEWGEGCGALLPPLDVCAYSRMSVCIAPLAGDRTLAPTHKQEYTAGMGLASSEKERKYER